MEHQVTYATFLDLDITIKDNIVIYKLFDKKDKFLFFIVRLPHVFTNVPSSTFYGSFYSKFQGLLGMHYFFLAYIKGICTLQLEGPSRRQHKTATELR